VDQVPRRVSESAPSDNEDAVIDLVLNSTGGITLMAQTSQIKQVVRDTITQVTGNMICVHSFPDSSMRMKWTKDELFHVARSLGFASLCKRLQSDAKYATLLASLVRRHPFE
jgi:hypothetical protein